ncbi:hypothetical protein GJAV_G00252790 [Gymnothorax javanicus]|nr:hypothetical protein GJAV_G00252790 [Gymnothorax javanicus]
MPSRVIHCKIRRRPWACFRKWTSLYRLAAYRQFTYWARGTLGKGVHRVIPSCAEQRIRETFQEASGQYEGFHEVFEG